MLQTEIFLHAILNTTYLTTRKYSCGLFLHFYVFLDAATPTEVFPCFFLGCKANARV